MTYIHVERIGEGERLFIGLPGWGGTHNRSFGMLFPYLPEDVTFYGMNLPGLGGSEGLAAPLSGWRWETITEALLRGFDALNLESPVTLVGACSGSYHALEIAMRRPEMTERVVLIEPFSYFPWFLRALVMPLFGPALYNVAFANQATRNLILRVMRAAGVMGEFDPFATWRETDPWVIYTYLKLYQELSDKLGAPHRFHRVKSPTRIIVGRNTFGEIIDSVEVWKGILEHLKVEWLADVGHQLTQDASDLAALHTFRAGD